MWNVNFKKTKLQKWEGGNIREGTWGFIGILHHNWAKIALRWKKDGQTSQRGFQSIPRVAFVNTETGELKKNKQTNRGPDWSVTICIPHLIFNQRRIFGFKPQLVRNSASYKNHLPNMSRDRDTAGDQTQARHSRAHRSRCSSLSSFKGQEELRWGQQSTRLYSQDSDRGALSPWCTGNYTSTIKALKPRYHAKWYFICQGHKNVKYSILNPYYAPKVLIWKYWLVDKVKIKFTCAEVIRLCVVGKSRQSCKLKSLT